MTPKDRLVFSVPPIDWNTRSTGALASASRIALVTCVSTQLCVGISKRWITSSSMRSSASSTGMLSDTGLMPITASPEPISRPSSVDAATPRRSSVGWLGCNRTERWRGSPSVLRKRVTTLHLRATAIRSWLRISFDTAAAISGVRPGASALSTAVLARSDSSQLRKSPTVRCATGAKASPS